MCGAQGCAMSESVAHIPRPPMPQDFADGSPPTLREFFDLEFPARVTLAGPIRSHSHVLVHGPTGVGKTQLANGIAIALGTGSSFLNWPTPERPVSVLLIDGEMPGGELQERLVAEIGGRTERADIGIVSVPDWLVANGAPALNLADPQWQAVVETWAANYEVIIADNLQSLVYRPGVSMASDEWWAPIGVWARRCTGKGHTVILNDHDNKQGSNFGTTTKTWGADLVIHLEKDDNFTPGACRFILKYEKSRGMHGALLQPLNVEVRLDGVANKWTYSPVSGYSMVAELANEGVSDGEIARALHITPSTVRGHKHRARKKGLIK